MKYLVSWRWIYNYFEGKIVQLSKALFIAEHPFFRELVMPARFDKLGRRADKETPYSRELIFEKLNRHVEKRFAFNGSLD